MRQGPPSETVGNVTVGDLLGDRYLLQRRVGVGGMATIYLATDRTLERDVAVKVLHPHLADDPSVRARFRTEGRHAASLSHPHVVHVYDQGAEDQPYLVMEYVDGPSLREVLGSRGRLPPAEALAIVEPLCRALGRAHARGLVHRDVKPENVLVAADGTVKLADFGIARALEGTHHTQTGALIGSVHYVAPEIVAGHGASALSDQYGIGVLLYELLTGRKPLEAESPMAVALRHGREPIPAPSASAPEVGAALDAVVATATALEPAGRFPDVDALAAALRAAVPQGPRPVLLRGDLDAGEHTLVIPAEGRRAEEEDRLADLGAVASHSDEAPTVAGAGDEAPTLPGTRKRSGDTDEFPVTGSAAGRGRRADRGRRASAGHGAGATPAAPVPAAAATAAEPDDGTPPRRRGRRLAVVLLGLVVLAALASGAALAAWHLMVAPPQQVPSLGGMHSDEARGELAARDLELRVDGEEHSRTVAEGVVLSQDPPPGTEVRSGETVGVVVSAGPAPVAMPHVEGGTFEEAASVLEGDPYYFTVRRNDFHHDHVPLGHVIAQAPARDRTLLQGATVDVAVSLGIEQVEVPDLAGMDRDEVEEAVEDARLRVEFSEAYSDEVPEAGVVASQSLDAGSEVDKNSVVEVTLSRGPLTIELPRVEGMDVADAVAELRALDLEVRVIEEPRPRIGPFRRGRFGRVEAQDPQRGTAVQRGQRIDLYTFTEGAEGGDDEEEEEDDDD